MPDGIVETLRCSGARDATQNARAQRESLSARFNAGAGFRFDLDVFCGVIENADADMVEAERFLNFDHNFVEHLLGIFARNGGLRNIVEKRKMMGTSLLLGKETCIFDGDGNLSGGGLHDLEIPRFEEIFAIVAHRRHNTSGLIGQQNRGGTK